LFLSCVLLISDSKIAEDEMTGEDEVMEVVLDRKLNQQISNAIDTRFLLQLVYLQMISLSSVKKFSLPFILKS